MTDALDRRAVLARDAEDAWRRGQAALAAGETAAAMRWLDRAARISPEDETIALGLATACLVADSARSAQLFAAIAAKHDLREAWLGLAVARLRCGDAAGARDGLVQALSRHVLSTDAAPTNDAVVRAADGPGWCAMSRQGVVAIGFTDAAVPLALTLDDASPAWLRPRSASAEIPLIRRLPAGWRSARRLHVAAGGRELAGSPIDLAAIRRVEGCVEWRDGALRGWAWHPADPERPPLLRVRSEHGRGGALSVRADGPLPHLAAVPLLGRPRGFVVSATALARLVVPVRVVGPGDADLLGSPLGAERGHTMSQVAPSRVARRSSRTPSRLVDVIVPVRDGGPTVRDCLDSVLSTAGPGARVIVVDDGSRDECTIATLDWLARHRRVRLIRHERSLGFPGAANAGLRALGARRDAVLLNSDTLVPPLWLERLREAAYAAADIGTACPLSNNATILSYPEPGRPAAMPDRAATGRMAALAHRANAGRVVEIPTAVGFCMFIRRACLDGVGLLREDVFAQGYGEENDFSMRARRLGWRHVAAPGVFVAHRGGLSFSGAAADLARRNAAVLRRLHPGYDDLVAAFVAADPLAPARRRLDARRWPRSPVGATCVLLVTHDRGGGVERHVAARCAELAAGGVRPIVLRPGTKRSAVMSDGITRDFPNLRFALPREFAALARFIARQRVERVEFHQLLDHHSDVMALPASLGLPYAVTIHDHAWFCPRITLVGGAGRYCGEPDLPGCEACVAAHGNNLDEAISVAALRARAASFLAGAARLAAPSADTAARMRRHFPNMAIEVAPHGPEPEPAPAHGRPTRHDRRIRVCVVGGIGTAKGYDVLVAAARDAATRRLPLDFTVVGLTEDDAPLIETGRVFITGPYLEGEAQTLIQAQQADLALLPSVWPETWCFALDECWRAGLDVMAFDIGAQAERIRRAGRGWLVPVGLSKGALNDALLAAARQTGHEWPQQRATSDCDLVAC